MERTKVNFKNDSLMSSIFSNILEDCDSRMPDLRLVCRDREILYTHKSIMVLFPVLRDSLCASPDSDAVIINVKKTSLQDLLSRIRSPGFTEAFVDSDILQLMQVDGSRFEKAEQDDITDEQLMEVECAMNEIDEHLEPEYHQEVVNENNEANPNVDIDDDLAENVTITPDIFQQSQNEDLCEEEKESVKNEPGMEASREIDHFLQTLKPQKNSKEDMKDDNDRTEGYKQPVDDNIESLLADSDEEIREPPQQNPKTSEQNQEFILCPYPKGHCSRKWKKYKGRNTVQMKNSMKNHILKAHYENEFTRLLKASFTGAGKCKQCKNKYSGLIQQKKHLWETHKAFQDELSPLLQKAFPGKPRRRPSNATKEISPLPASNKKDSSKVIEEIQSRLSQDLSDDSSDDDEEESRSFNKKSVPPQNDNDLRNQITIDFGSDSE